MFHSDFRYSASPVAETTGKHCCAWIPYKKCLCPGWDWDKKVTDFQPALRSFEADKISYTGRKVSQEYSKIGTKEKKEHYDTLHYDILHKDKQVYKI